MEFVDAARAQLVPLIEEVLALSGGPFSLPDADAEPMSGFGATDLSQLPLRGFFTNILAKTHGMQVEEDVLGLFFELSTTAFLGFEYPATVAVAIDDLLAAAEQIAFTMTASGEAPH